MYNKSIYLKLSEIYLGFLFEECYLLTFKMLYNKSLSKIIL